MQDELKRIREEIRIKVQKIDSETTKRHKNEMSDSKNLNKVHKH